MVIFTIFLCIFLKNLLFWRVLQEFLLKLTCCWRLYCFWHLCCSCVAVVAFTIAVACGPANECVASIPAAAGVPSVPDVLRGASKIKLKNVNKNRMATARRFVLEFLKATIADLIIWLFSSLQNSERGGDGDSSESCADPCQLLPFPKTKI